MERTIVKDGFTLLKKEKQYDQTTVVYKLNFLGTKVSKAAFNNIVNDKPVGEKLLHKVSHGIQELIKKELGFCWENTGFVKDSTMGLEPVTVGKLMPTDPALVLKPGFAFHADGRLPIAQKVRFFSTAQKEVIEFGVTLNTFNSYFYNRNDKEFKSHIEALLEKGVHFKCFLLNPDFNEARVYFNDGKARKDDERKIKESIDRLTDIQGEFGKNNYSGTFEVFTYRHIPNNYFMAVDGGESTGKLMVSHYIYGEPRAKCPVIEISNKDNSVLFRRYWESLKKLMEGAAPIASKR